MAVEIGNPRAGFVSSSWPITATGPMCHFKKEAHARICGQGRLYTHEGSLHTPRAFSFLLLPPTFSAIANGIILAWRSNTRLMVVEGIALKHMLFSCWISGKIRGED